MTYGETDVEGANTEVVIGELSMEDDSSCVHTAPESTDASIYYEPLTDEKLATEPLEPFKYPTLWKMHKQLEGAIWSAQSVDHSTDRISINKMNKDVKQSLKRMMPFFAGSEIVVLKNVLNNFGDEIKPRCAKAFYPSQAQNEQVHDESYQLQVAICADDEEERQRMLHAVDDSEYIKAKFDWASKWFDRSKYSLHMRLAAFVAVEGIMFSSSFAFILWLKKQGLVPGICAANDYIMVDEGLHRDYGIAMFNLLNYRNRPSQEDIHAMMKEAVALECAFANYVLGDGLNGLNIELMSDYITTLADSILIQLGYDKIWNTVNHLTFTEMNNLDGKTNFFEKRGNDYKKAALTINKRATDFDNLPIIARYEGGEPTEVVVHN